eukprot:3363664-Karenia_brevis.AAC.1
MLAREKTPSRFQQTVCHVQSFEQWKFLARCPILPHGIQQGDMILETPLMWRFSGEQRRKPSLANNV